MSDYSDEGGGHEERDVRYSEEAGPWASRSSVGSAGEAANLLADAAARSTAKGILWWIALVLFMAVTVALIKTVTIVGVVVGTVGVSLLAWDEERSWRRRGRRQSQAPVSTAPVCGAPSDQAAADVPRRLSGVGVPPVRAVEVARSALSLVRRADGVLALVACQAIAGAHRSRAGSA